MALSTRTRGRLRRVAQVAAALAAVGAGIVCYTFLTLPDVRPLATHNPETTAFQDLRARQARAEGKPARKIQRWVSYRNISPQLKRAVIVAEDAAFWQHEGIDLDEIRASIETNWMRGAFLRGGSTITQQLAKNLYLSPSRNPYRKFKELLITRRLEGELSKARIFEIYLNVIEWGDGIWGVEAAARTYFGVPASALDARQSALLAGAIINPRVYSPARPNARLLRRQQIILGRMGAVTAPSTPEPAPDEKADEDAGASGDRPIPSRDLPVTTTLPGGASGSGS
ncbi:MAG: monofunctional biosynthetic peptidoglycan transglycosylase [Vicinamibacterales bacterium]